MAEGSLSAGEHAGKFEFHPLANLFPMLEGDELAELAEDIREQGLQQLIVIHDGMILDGRNRYVACVQAKVTPRFRPYDGDDPLAFVISANLKRRHLSESQRAMVAARIANLEPGRPSEKASIDAITQAAAAKLLNVSEPSVERATRVQKSGAPELVEAVDQGRIPVSAAAHIAREPIEEQRTILASDEVAIKKAAAELAQKRARENAEKRAALAAQQAVMPTAGYRCIVLDPPWPMQKIERDVRPNQVGFDYPTMSEDELAAFELPAANDCHLFCWTTHKFLPMALRLLDAWGFRYVCTLVWRKPGGFQPIGLPQYNCEFALYARKGSPTFVDTKAFFCCFDGERREHSRKPDEFYDIVRRVTAGPRIDVFSRELRDGFDQFGNEAEKFEGAA